MSKPVRWLIERAKRTPYFHLFHADGTLYMERYWLVPFAGDKEGCYRATWREPFTWLLQKLGVAVRVHCIHTPDLDRAMHDHPWTFASLVLRGWYIEDRPITPNNARFETCFEYGPGEHALGRAPILEAIKEPAVGAIRKAGSFAVRRFFERHRIIAVSHGGVWTLFVSFRKRQSWGFFTPQGKIWWWQFESVHNNKAIK